MDSLFFLPYIPMPKKPAKDPEPKRSPISTEEIYSTVEAEGLGNAILNFYHGDLFEDPHLHRLWIEARYALAKLDQYLEETTVFGNLDELDAEIDWRDRQHSEDEDIDNDEET